MALRRERQIAAALVLGGMLVLSLLGLWRVRPVLAPFLIAIVIAYLIAPLVHLLEARGLQTAWAILVVYLAILLVLGLVIFRILPPIIAQGRSFLGALPAYAVQVQEIFVWVQERIRAMGLPTPLHKQIDGAIVGLVGGATGIVLGFLEAGTLMQIFEVVGAIVLAPFVAFYLLRDMGGFKTGFVRALPRRYRQEILSLLRQLDLVISGYLRGAIILGAIVGSLGALACYFLKIPYALLLGLWSGLMEFIPYLGPVLGAGPAILVALAISPLKALQVAIAYAIIQQIEGSVLSPNIMGHSVGLHPVVTIFAILVGGYLGGIGGMLLALPLTGVLKVLASFLIDRLTEVSPGAVIAAQGGQKEEPPGPR
jgi:predicted PurR-regulated permease PerM